MVAENGKKAGMCLNHISGLLAVRLILHLSGKESASMDTTVYPSLESIIKLCLQEVDQATGKKAVISSSTPADKSKTESACASASAAPSKTVADIHSKRIALGERFALGDCVIRKGAPAEGLWQVQAMKETEVNLVQAGWGHKEQLAIKKITPDSFMENYMKYKGKRQSQLMSGQQFDMCSPIKQAKLDQLKAIVLLNIYDAYQECNEGHDILDLYDNPKEMRIAMDLRKNWLHLVAFNKIIYTAPYDPKKLTEYQLMVAATKDHDVYIIT
jgi:hypothetical protein